MSCNDKFLVIVSPHTAHNGPREMKMTTYTRSDVIRDISDLTANHFYGVDKTACELRDFVKRAVETFSMLGGKLPVFDLSADEIEAIARDNEARQGVKLFA